MAASLTLKDRGEDMARVNVFLSPKSFTTPPLEAFLSVNWVTRAGLPQELIAWDHVRRQISLKIF